MSESGAFDAKLRDAFEPAYILEHELTGGGMSRVFLATERALNRKVVIKVLPPELAAGVNRERFRREIQLAAQLQHPHIVPLYAAGEHGDLLYYTMPFIEGESLKQAIHEHGKKRPFTTREVVRILHDVSDALAYAHARGVIHRDIKPGNVLRSGSHAVVTDFGVAKAISAALPAVGMTTSGMAIGTPAYMAPEQLAGDPAADHRVDLYAVGLLAYELLTGEAPFNETSPQATLAAQMTRDPVAVVRKRPDVPPALAALVMRCLAKMPEERPQLASELVAELDAMPMGSGDFVPATVNIRRWRAAVVSMGGFATIAALALLAGAVMFSRRGHATGLATPSVAPGAASAEANRARPRAAPPSLTRAESLAIATAVESRMANRRAAAAATLDSAAILSITSDAIRIVFDSLQKLRPPEPQAGAQGTQRFGRRDGSNFAGMTRAQIDSVVRSTRNTIEFAGGFPQRGTVTLSIPPRGSADRVAYDARFANMGPPRRIVVADPPPDPQHPELQTAGVQLMDALRRALSGARRFVLVDRDSTQAILQRTRNRQAVMRTLNADMNASIRVLPTPGADSARLVVTLFDQSSQARSQVISLGPVPLSAVASLADSVSRLSMRALWLLDHTPRRTGDAGRSGPTAPHRRLGSSDFL